MKFDLAVVPDAHSLAVDRTVNAPPVTRAVLSNKSSSAPQEVGPRSLSKLAHQI
jgi:hypothetical protein